MNTLRPAIRRFFCFSLTFNSVGIKSTFLRIGWNGCLGNLAPADHLCFISCHSLSRCLPPRHPARQLLECSLMSNPTRSWAHALPHGPRHIAPPHGSQAAAPPAMGCASCAPLIVCVLFLPLGHGILENWNDDTHSYALNGHHRS